MDGSVDPKAYIDAFLEHHGVKGMKWGVRKSSNSRGSSLKKGQKYHKSAGQLTDAELRKRITRLELEKKYTDLNKPTMAKGQKFTNDVLSNAGKRYLTDLLVGGMAAVGAAVGVYLKGKYSSK